MASHDYYNSYPQQDTSYASGGRSNQPLPPIPSSPSTRPQKPYIETSGISPQSPFHDDAYPAYPPPSQSHSHMPDYAERPSYSHDPFRDSNAIPLQSQTSLKKPGAYVSTSPTSAMGEAEQQYPPRRSDKRRPSTRRKKEQGWFRGKITWAVFVLTLVQFTVFIVEIVRNGMRHLHFKSSSILTRRNSTTNRLPD
jgi:hypothetical protein